ncbi:MAG: response regulator [Bauldia sp.]|nr:response regulator [Bauldia sp.]
MPSAVDPEEAVLVLVVEDDGLTQHIVRSALEDAGFGVVVASTGPAAIELLEGSRGGAIRAVVTDVNLGPGTNGWQVARRAREIWSDMPLLYVTGGNSEEWDVNGVPQSMLISKPFAPAQIVTAVSQVLNAAPPESAEAKKTGTSA